jgi:folate-binding protein YgfZ
LALTPDSVERELGFLDESAGIVEHLDRTIVEIAGDRAIDMIAGLLTNDVAELEVDRALYSFMLTPKGRPVAEMRVIRRSQGLWLDMPAVCRQGALDHLSRYLPPRLARFKELERRHRLSVVGPLASKALESIALSPGAADLDPLQASHAELPPLATVVRRESIEGPGFDLYVTEMAGWRQLLEQPVSAVGGGDAGPEAYEAWRIRRGIPVYAAEIDTEVLPQETGQEKRAVSFTKGCYTGQEVVARIHYRGHVNRHLRGLRFGESAETGAVLFDGERPVGRVTSVAEHPALGAIGLGYVRREVEPPAELALEPGGRRSCSVSALPIPRRKAAR